MNFIPKIKNIQLIYSIKIKIRNIKHLIKNVIFLIFNQTSLEKVINYIKNYYKSKKIKFDTKYLYENKSFKQGDWFSHKTALLVDYFDKQKDNIHEILEIGSYEGRSACFFLSYFKNCKLTCVDTWKGSDEHLNSSSDFKKIENNFDQNVFEFQNKVVKIKKNSRDFFKENRQKFDFIHIDASHFYDDVLNDANEGLKFLKKDSYMLFDDYDWKFYKFGQNPVNAINFFLKVNKKKIKIIYISSQVLIKKI